MTTTDLPVAYPTRLRGWPTGAADRTRRLVRGRVADPRWARPALLLLLVGTLVAFLWDLSANAWGNEFYAAAIQAGSKSWKAFLFGSSDAANTITVDKPPASLWIPELSVRVFGLSSWSVLVPQALMGTATVGVVYAAVRRYFTVGAALIAGLAVATTPVAALMFRFDNPDALLTLLMSAAAYFALRALAEDKLRWYLLCGAAVGFGFLAKQLQVFLIAPALALALLVAGQGGVFRRLRGLILATLSIVVSAGWWVTLTALWPKNSRPYIGGSEHNSFLELTFGYNGFGRITGNEATGLGGFGGGGNLGDLPEAVRNLGDVPRGGAPGGGGGIFGGATGLKRLFDGVVGGQISWLMPAALLTIVVGFVICGRAARTDMRRASLLVWGGWLITTALVFSYMSGIFHEYYTVALVPAVGALVGIGASLIWQRRDQRAALAAGAVAIAVTVWWAYVLLDRASNWNAWLRLMTIALGAVAVAALAVLAIGGTRIDRGRRAVCFVAGAFGIAAIFAGPLAWTVQTVGTAHTGSIVTAGPAVSQGGRGGFPGAGAVTGRGGASNPQIQELLEELPESARAEIEATFGQLPGGESVTSGAERPEGVPSGGSFTPPSGAAGPPSGEFSGPPPSGTGNQEAANGNPDEANQPGGTRAAEIPGFPGAGGLGAAAGFGSASPSKKVLALLETDANNYTWVAATMGATSAAPYQLATQHSVMPIGGFSGSDPAPTLAAFERDVAQHKIHWFISGGGPGGFAGAGGRGGTSIASWVSQRFTAETVDGVTMYDLTKVPKATTGP